MAHQWRKYEKMGSIDLKRVHSLVKSSPLSNEEQLTFLSKLLGLHEKLFDISILGNNPLCLNYKNDDILYKLNGGASESIDIQKIREERDRNYWGIYNNAVSLNGVSIENLTECPYNNVLYNIDAYLEWASRYANEENDNYRTFLHFYYNEIDKTRIIYHKNVINLYKKSKNCIFFNIV